MVLPAIFMYLGTKMTVNFLGRRQTIDNNDFIRPPATAPTLPSTQQATQQATEKKFFNGIIKNDYFYLDDKVLNLSGIVVHDICIHPLSATPKPYSGKITMTGNSGEVFKHEYNQNVRVLTLPNGGLEVDNVTVKVKKKSGEAVALQYSVVYSA